MLEDSLDLRVTAKAFINTHGHSEANSIRLYDANSIEQVQWPEDYNGQYAKDFLVPLMKKGLSTYILNVDAEMLALKIDNLVLPILAPRKNHLNSYICSPYHHYITFGKENVHLLKNQMAILAIKSLFLPLGKMISFGHLDSVVYVNHWLSATDLYPNNIQKKQLSQIIGLLQERFPNQAIIFRSLNTVSTPHVPQYLVDLGCQLIASRYIYLSDACDESIFQTRIVKSDLRLWNKHHFEYVNEHEAKEENCKEFFALTRLLYVIQHSDLHPQYSEEYIRLLFNRQLLKFKSLRREGRCVGVAGYFERDGIMYCPLLGFDKQDPEQSLIFRLLNTALLLEAKNQKCLFNQSAGASFYKSVRRAKGALEFSAVFTRHLPRKQKLAWSLLINFINTFAPKFMRRY